MKIKLVKFKNTLYLQLLKLLVHENCFLEIFGNSNPGKLCASKIWIYTVLTVWDAQ